MEEESKDDEGSQIWGSDFGLLCSGLFNFYQFASFEVKELYIELMEKYLLKFEEELHLCLPGFLSSLLPGIDDQNEAMSRKVERVLKETETIVGTRYFYGTIWQSLMNSARVRMGALKFIEKNIPKNWEQYKNMEMEVFPLR